MKRIRGIVEELTQKYALTENAEPACALAEFCDTVRSLPLDEETKAEAHHAARQVAASVIGALLPEIAAELAERLADRRISEAA